jgi:hypothetical protein
MPIDALPAAPAPTDSRATMSAKAFAWVAALVGWTTQATALEANVNEKEALATAAAVAAANSEAVARGVSNFKGTYAAQVGALAVPASVSHAGLFWMLLQNVADVTTQVPGAAPAYWQQIAAMVGNASGGVNWLGGPNIASAATPNIWAQAQGNVMTVTGVVATTGFAAAPQAGATRTLIAAGAWPLTHGANLILPGSVNYVCAAGDRLEVVAVTVNQFRVSIFKADGSAVVGVPGYVLLASSGLVAGAAAIDFTALIDGTYDEYLFSLVNVYPSSGSAKLEMQTSANAGGAWDSGAGAYGYSGEELLNASSANYLQSASDTKISTSVNALSTTAAHGGICGEIRLFNPASATIHKVLTWALSAMAGAGSVFFLAGGGVRVATAAVNGIRFKANTGNINGTIYMLGRKK